MTGLKQNQNQWELVAKKLLEKEGRQPDPNYLYSLQLLQWALDKYELTGPWSNFQDQLIERVVRMFVWNPDHVRQTLWKDFEMDEKKLGNASDLGMLLLENLDASLNLY